MSRRWPSIPGETPIDDISGLKLPDVRSRRELSAVEAENVRHAVVKYLGARPSKRLAPFDYPWVLRLHGEMFGQVWNWAGKLRKSRTNLGCDPSQISVHLHNLLEDLKAWQFDPIEQAATLHFRAVAIHPFENGNGRWSRLLANIWLKRHNYPPTLWPEETIGDESVIRSSYLAAIKAADKGDLAPLIALHRQYSG